MKTSVSPIKLVVCTASISFSLLVPQLSWAQTTPTTSSNNALEDLEQQNRNPFSSHSDDGNAMNGIMDLMHRAQMGNIRSVNEYSAEQDRSLNDAASQFRQKQLQMIRNQNQNSANPANSANTPNSGN
jgi:hypothetical protein